MKSDNAKQSLRRFSFADLESPEVTIIYNLLLWIKVIGGVMLDKTEKKIYGILLLVLAVLALLLAYFFCRRPQMPRPLPKITALPSMSPLCKNRA